MNAHFFPLETVNLPEMPVMTIGGVDVLAVSQQDAAELLHARLKAGVFTRLAFLNAHCVNMAYADEDYRRCLEDFLVLSDGVGVDFGAMLLHGRPFPANLNGTDFVPHLLSTVEEPLRVALFGASPGVAEAAAERFACIAPQHAFIPVAHGYFSGPVETERAIAKLRAARVDVALIALGVPRQEKFIASLSGSEARLVIGVGALLDFMAGKVARAPRVLRMLRLEWFYRFLHEPRRLFRRYILGNPFFVLRVALEYLRRAKS